MERKPTERDYHVVFEGTGKKGSNWKGVRTISSYVSKEEFLQQQAISNDGDLVIAHGVPYETAQGLADRTSTQAHLNAALQDSTKLDGTIDSSRLDMHLKNIEWVRPGVIKTRSGN